MAAKIEHDRRKYNNKKEKMPDIFDCTIEYSCGFCTFAANVETLLQNFTIEMRIVLNKRGWIEKFADENCCGTKAASLNKYIYLKLIETIFNAENFDEYLIAADLAKEIGHWGGAIILPKRKLAKYLKAAEDGINRENIFVDRSSSANVIEKEAFEQEYEIIFK